MAHNTYELIAQDLERKRKRQEQKEVLQEMYELIDVYNEYVKEIDKKMDRIVSKLELIENDYS